jgi:hypothetical protein
MTRDPTPLQNKSTRPASRPSPAEHAVRCRKERSTRSRSFIGERNRTFARHLVREADAIFTFLTNDTDAANWRAEQAIRPAVVNRRTYGGNRDRQWSKNTVRAHELPRDRPATRPRRRRTPCRTRPRTRTDTRFHDSLKTVGDAQPIHFKSDKRAPVNRDTASQLPWGMLIGSRWIR